MGSTTSKSDCLQSDSCKSDSCKIDPYLYASKDTDLSEFRSEMAKRTNQPRQRWDFYDLVKNDEVDAIRYLSKVNGPELMRQVCWQSKYKLMDVLLEKNHILSSVLLDISHGLADEIMVRKLLDHGCTTEVYGKRNPQLKKLIWEVCHPKNLFLDDEFPRPEVTISIHNRPRPSRFLPKDH